MDAKEEIEAAIKMVQQSKLKPSGSAEKDPAEPDFLDSSEISVR